ncbi:MAG: glycerol-3-phosphate acyltransferase [Bacillota bacterium]|nr:glycerol-3-phosphate acyltransferase [Bacillota bacterium]
MDINFVNIITALICVVGGFLIGSFPTGVIIGKVFFHKDIRDYGSHNSGGTNAGRVLGRPIGFLVIVIDMIKTIGVIYAAYAILSFTGLHEYYVFDNGSTVFSNITPMYYWLTGLAAAFGHCYSPWIGFKGGKAAASFMGMCCLTSWLGFCTGFIYLATLKFKKIVSLSAIVGGFAQLLAAWIVFIVEATTGFNSGFFSWLFFLGEDALQLGFWYAIAVSVIYILMVYRHVPNIIRMKQGTESKITWMK